MRPLNDPRSCLEQWILFDQFLLFASWPDVGDESVGYYGFLFAICRIKAELFSHNDLDILWNIKNLVLDTNFLCGKIPFKVEIFLV
jgi:hypothetical protein